MADQGSIINKGLELLGIDLKPKDAKLIVTGNDHNMLYDGAHIATGEDGYGNQYHHGIIIDRKGDMRIVHFWGEDKTDAKIQETNLPAFVAGHPSQAHKKSRPLFLIHYNQDNEQKRLQTVERAKNLLKQPHSAYNLILNNCECIAVYCRTGSEEVFSQQVVTAMDEIIKKVGPVVSAVGKKIKGSFS